MQRSSLQSINKGMVLLALLTLTLVTGCLKPDKKSESQLRESGARNSTFRLLEVKGESEPSKLHKDWMYPTERAFVFTACVQDRITENRIIGHEFTIETADKEHIKKTTDRNGCLVWQEEIGYNYLANSKYIELPHKIIGTGLYKGEEPLRIAINPWVEDRRLEAEEVRDLNFNPLPPKFIKGPAQSHMGLHGLTEEGMREDRHLWIDRIDIESFATTYDSKGGLQETTISFEPRFMVQDHLGEKLWPKLENGLFRVMAKFYLVSRDGEYGKEERTLVGEWVPPAGALKTDKRMMFGPVKKVRDGYLRVTLPIRINHLSDKGTLEVALRVTPVNMPTPLKTFEGVFLVGSPKRLLSSGSARLRDFVREDFPQFDLETWEKQQDVKSAVFLEEQLRLAKEEAQKISQKIADKGASDASLKQELEAAQGKVHALQMRMDGIYELEQFDFTELDVRFLSVDKETSAERTIKVRVSTCVSDPRTGDGLRDLHFVVRGKKSDGFPEINQPVETKFRKGCIYWVDTITHKYYQVERYFTRTFELEHLKSGAKSKVAMVLNPWDWGWTFGQDSLSLGQKYFDEVNSEEKIESKLIIYNFRYETVGFRYEIDEFMSLKVIKTLLLRFDPRVMRFSSITQGRNKNEPLRDGAYLLKVAVQKNDTSQGGKSNELLSVYQDIVRVRGGVVIHEIELSVRDLRFMRIRDHFLLELSPIDERKILKPGSEDFTDDFDLGDRTNYDDLILDADKYGLASRTFIGPIIPLTNYFSAGLRPTDNIERAENKSLIDATNLDHTFDSMDDFKDVTVTQLLERHKKHEREFLEDMRNRSRFDNWAQRYNADYLQLFDDQLRKQRFSKVPLSEVNAFVPAGDDQAKAFADELSEDQIPYSFGGAFRASPAQVSVDDLSELLATGVMSQPLARAMCHYWYGKVAPQILGKSVKQFYKHHKVDRLWQLISDCEKDQMKVADKAQASDVAEAVRMGLGSAGMAKLTEHMQPFSINERIKVHNIKDYEFARGMSMNLQVGSDIRLNHYNDYKVNVNRNFRPFKALLDGVFGFVQSFFGVDYSVGISNGDGESRGRGHGSSTGTYLVIQMAKFDIQLDKYERCISMQPNGEYLGEKGVNEIINDNISELDRFKALSRGLLICSGVVETEPMTRRETYYYFAQHFVTGDLLDLGDKKNHPWLLALRGYKDYRNFLRSIQDVEVLDKTQRLEKMQQLAAMDEILERGQDKEGLLTGFKSSIESISGFEGEANKVRDANVEHYGNQLRFKNIMRDGQFAFAPRVGEGDGRQQIDNQPVKLDSEAEKRRREQYYKFYVKQSERYSIDELQKELYDKEGYDISDFPIDHTAAVYLGTLPSFPGFITITPESFEVDAPY